MAKVNVNRTTLYYEKTGKGPAVIFIHGFGLDSRMWDAQFLQFARQYTVVRYDLRGFEQSALPTESENYTHQQDLEALPNELELDQVVLVGIYGGQGGYPFCAFLSFQNFGVDPGRQHPRRVCHAEL